MTLAALRADARACLDAALAAVDPALLVASRLRRRDDGLVLTDAAGRELGRHVGPVLVAAAIPSPTKTAPRRRRRAKPAAADA